MADVKRFLGRVSCAAVAAAAGSAIAGPDVILADIQSTTNYGQIGSIRAYAIGSHTCNIGDANLLWNNAGTPGLGMNLYRLYDGRLMQIGLSHAKTACCAAASTSSLCGGTCNGAGGSVLGFRCLDVYSASWNGGQSRLGPRSAMNAWTGAFQTFSGTTGDAIWRRLQVQQSDLLATNFPGALYFVEGVYVATDDAQSGNRNNNATYKRVTVDQSTFNLTLTGSPYATIPAIQAWRDHGLGPNTPDTSVTVGQVDVPGEGRFWYAYKVRDNGNGTWRYDYAVFNLSSDRSGGGFRVPVPSGVTVSGIGFNAPFYHSDEPYSNTPWNASNGGSEVVWSSPQTFAQNPNTNALRWGTMYNFWFTANSGPTTGTVTLDLFKPGTPSFVTFTAQVPSAGACYANCDGSTTVPILNVADFTCFLQRFANGDPYANCDGSTSPPVLNVADFTCFLQRFAQGCN